MTAKRFHVTTFGCQMNEHDSERMKGMLESLGYCEAAGQVGAELKDGLREGPSWIAFARENGTVYHTYTALAPNPFVATYMDMLLDGTPKGDPFGDEPRNWRKDEYPEG